MTMAHDRIEAVTATRRPGYRWFWFGATVGVVAVVLLAGVNREDISGLLAYGGEGTLTTDRAFPNGTSVLICVALPLLYALMLAAIFNGLRYCQKDIEVSGSKVGWMASGWLYLALLRIMPDAVATVPFAGLLVTAAI